MDPQRKFTFNFLSNKVTITEGDCKKAVKIFNDVATFVSEDSERIAKVKSYTESLGYGLRFCLIAIVVVGTATLAGIYFAPDLIDGIFIGFIGNMYIIALRFVAMGILVLLILATLLYWLAISKKEKR